MAETQVKEKQYIAKFRSYDSLDDGVLNYISFLKNRPAVMAAMKEDASPKEFSYALAKVHYYDPYIRDDYTDKNGKKVPGYTTGLTSRYNDFISKFKSGKINPNKIQESPKQTEQMLADKNIQPQFINQINNFLDSFAFQNNNIIKSSFSDKKFNIEIKSDNDFSSKLEYARILCIALKEELNAKSEILIDKDNIQIECIVNANDKGELVVKELCNAISNVFHDATKKIGGVKINTNILYNTESKYQKLNIKLAETNYRKFHLKFATGK